MSENGEIYTAGQKIYTAAGSDGSDKSHLCLSFSFIFWWIGVKGWKTAIFRKLFVMARAEENVESAPTATLYHSLA